MLLAEVAEPAGSPSFEALLGEILPRAYGVAYNLTRNGADAEDLLQDAALRAFRAFSSFAPGSHFKAWFFKILTHRHFERHRSSGRTPETVDLDDAPDLFLYQRTAEAGLHQGCDDPAGLVMSKLTAEQVMDAIAALPGEFRVVATLHFADDLTYQEIAEVLGCPVGTVRSRLHRSRKLLQRALWTLAEQSGIVGAPAARRASA